MTTRGEARKLATPLDFFKLFFTVEFVQQLCQFTNMNAAEVGPTKPSVFTNCYAVTVEEFYRFVGVLIYGSVVSVPTVGRMWSARSLYNGLWARAFMTMDRYKAILSFLKVCNPSTEDKNDKLTKARNFCKYISMKCLKLYQPDQNVSIDERMVKNKGQYSFRQYIRDKPTKWGMKLWVLADSRSGYTFNFEIYLGKSDKILKFGLAYDVVMNLMKVLTNQGYHLYFDNFYTSTKLLKDLLVVGTYACGTMLHNRVGYPQQLKDIKQFNKTAARGGMRWVRMTNILCVQWKDNRVVSILSTIHTANKETTAIRKEKS